MNIVINGETREMAAASTVAHVLDLFGIDPAITLVQLNDDIVERSRFAETTLSAGDRIELVRFVAGG